MSDKNPRVNGWYAKWLREHEETKRLLKDIDILSTELAKAELHARTLQEAYNGAVAAQSEAQRAASAELMKERLGTRSLLNDANRRLQRAELCAKAYADAMAKAIDLIATSRINCD